MEGALQQAQQQRPQSPQQPVVFTHQQLQVAVDRGEITPSLMADTLARQHAQAYATQSTLALAQAQKLDGKIRSALAEVNQYIEKVPSLRDNTSSEFARVRDEAYRLSDDMGLSVDDFRVQRAALRATLGSLDRIATASNVRQQSRDASLPHVESSVGHGGGSQTGKVTDPLKDVDPTYIKFWQGRGYTQQQMIDESKYIPKGRKVRPGAPQGA